MHDSFLVIGGARLLNWLRSRSRLIFRKPPSRATVLLGSSVFLIFALRMAYFTVIGVLVLLGCLFLSVNGWGYLGWPTEWAVFVFGGGIIALFFNKEQFWELRDFFNSNAGRPRNQEASTSGIVRCSACDASNKLPRDLTSRLRKGAPVCKRCRTRLDGFLTDQQAVEIVGEYGTILEAERGFASPDSDLPFPKPIIRAAIVQVLGHASEGPAKDALQVGYVCLEHFLPVDDFELIEPFLASLAAVPRDISAASKEDLDIALSETGEHGDRAAQILRSINLRSNERLRELKNLKG